MNARALIIKTESLNFIIGNVVNDMVSGVTRVLILGGQGGGGGS